MVIEKTPPRPGTSLKTWARLSLIQSRTTGWAVHNAKYPRQQKAEGQ